MFENISLPNNIGNITMNFAFKPRLDREEYWPHVRVGVASPDRTETLEFNIHRLDTRFGEDLTLERLPELDEDTSESASWKAILENFVEYLNAQIYRIDNRYRVDGVVLEDPIRSSSLPTKPYFSQRFHRTVSMFESIVRGKAPREIHIPRQWPPSALIRTVDPIKAIQQLTLPATLKYVQQSQDDTIKEVALEWRDDPTVAETMFWFVFNYEAPYPFDISKISFGNEMTASRSLSLYEVSTGERANLSGHDWRRMLERVADHFDGQLQALHTTLRTSFVDTRGMDVPDQLARHWIGESPWRNALRGRPSKVYVFPK